MNALATCPLHRHADLARRIEALEMRPDPELLLPELTRLREASESALVTSAANANVQKELFNEVGNLKQQVAGLSKQLVELQGRMVVELQTQMRFLADSLRDERQSRHEIEVESRRDMLDERKSRRSLRNKLVVIVVSFIASTLAAYQGGRASRSPQCSHSAIAR